MHVNEALIVHNYGSYKQTHACDIAMYMTPDQPILHFYEKLH